MLETVIWIVVGVVAAFMVARLVLKWFFRNLK